MTILRAGEPTKLASAIRRTRSVLTPFFKAYATIAELAGLLSAKLVGEILQVNVVHVSHHLPDMDTGASHQGCSSSSHSH